MTPSNNSPCKDCPNRHIGCHSECEDYGDYKKAYEEYNNMVKEAKNIENLVSPRKKYYKTTRGYWRIK